MTNPDPMPSLPETGPRLLPGLATRKGVGEGPEA